jgi:hypothetical protein
MIGQYYLIPISILLSIIYLLSYFLYTDDKITETVYKFIWALILVLNTFIVGISGLVMEVFINLQMLPINSILIFWHVEAGILTCITGIFHLHIYWKTFKNIF